MAVIDTIGSVAAFQAAGSLLGSAGSAASAGISSAAQIAVATINTAAQIKIAEMQYSISKGYYDMARELRDYWNTTFKPAEQEEVAEARAMPLYDPRYSLTAGRFATTVRMQFGSKMNELARAASRYCTGLTATMMRDVAVAEALAVGDAVNLAYRYEEGRKEVLDDRRWGRRHNAVGLGRDLLGQSAQYGSLASQGLQNLGNQAGRAAEGAARALGSGANRNPTNYPGGSGARSGSSLDGLASRSNGLDDFLAANQNFGTTPDSLDGLLASNGAFDTAAAAEALPSIEELALLAL